jgi:hypothetical protein
MSTSHPGNCQCSLHNQVEARRHECYRQLARAIIGPAAPLEDTALATALAAHALLLQQPVVTNVTPIRRHRAA